MSAARSEALPKTRSPNLLRSSRPSESIASGKRAAISEACPATSLSAQEIGHLFSKLTVGEIMTHSVITGGPDRPAQEAGQLMLDHTIGALPVLADGQLAGIITETDIVRAFVDTTAAASASRP